VTARVTGDFPAHGPVRPKRIGRIA
jgi:hypothetical protein